MSLDVYRTVLYRNIYGKLLCADNAEEPTAIELGIAWRADKDGYLAIFFLINSDQRCYGGLIRDIENEHTRGTDTYPSTLGGAYDYLVNYKCPRMSSNDQDEGGLAFLHEDDQSDSGRGRGGGGRGRGRGGRGGRGQGGRGGRGGRGRGGRGESGTGNTDTPTESSRAPEGETATTGSPRHSKADDANDHDNAQYLIDNPDGNLESDEEYLPSPLGRTTSNCFQLLEQANRLSGNILLLDSCLSVNLVCNGDLLHDITTVEWSMSVRCNAEVRKRNQQGRLGDFPEPV
jgi:hypothetical protein